MTHHDEDRGRWTGTRSKRKLPPIFGRSASGTCAQTRTRLLAPTWGGCSVSRPPVAYGRSRNTCAQPGLHATFSLRTGLCAPLEGASRKPPALRVFAPVSAELEPDI